MHIWTLFRPITPLTIHIFVYLSPESRSVLELLCILSSHSQTNWNAPFSRTSAKNLLPGDPLKVCTVKWDAIAAELNMSVRVDPVSTLVYTQHQFSSVCVPGHTTKHTHTLTHWPVSWLQHKPLRDDMGQHYWKHQHEKMILSSDYPCPSWFLFLLKWYLYLWSFDVG